MAHDFDKAFEDLEKKGGGGKDARFQVQGRSIPIYSAESLKRCIQDFITTGRYLSNILIILGDAGIGKTYMINDLSKTMGLGVISLNLGAMTSADFAGVPFINEIKEENLMRMFIKVSRVNDMKVNIMQIDADDYNDFETINSLGKSGKILPTSFKKADNLKNIGIERTRNFNPDEYVYDDNELFFDDSGKLTSAEREDRKKVEITKTVTLDSSEISKFLSDKKDTISGKMLDLFAHNVFVNICFQIEDTQLMRMETFFSFFNTRTRQKLKKIKMEEFSAENIQQYKIYAEAHDVGMIFTYEYFIDLLKGINSELASACIDKEVTGKLYQLATTIGLVYNRKYASDKEKGRIGSMVGDMSVVTKKIDSDVEGIFLIPKALKKMVDFADMANTGDTSVFDDDDDSNFRKSTVKNVPKHYVLFMDEINRTGNNKELYNQYFKIATGGDSGEYKNVVKIAAMNIGGQYVASDDEGGDSTLLKDMAGNERFEWAFYTPDDATILDILMSNYKDVPFMFTRKMKLPVYGFFTEDEIKKRSKQCETLLENYKELYKSRQNDKESSSVVKEMNKIKEKITSIMFGSEYIEAFFIFEKFEKSKKLENNSKIFSLVVIYNEVKTIPGFVNYLMGSDGISNIDISGGEKEKERIRGIISSTKIDRHEFEFPSETKRAGFNTFVGGDTMDGSSWISLRFYEIFKKIMSTTFIEKTSSIYQRIQSYLYDSIYNRVVLDRKDAFTLPSDFGGDLKEFSMYPFMEALLVILNNITPNFAGSLKFRKVFKEYISFVSRISSPEEFDGKVQKGNTLDSEAYSLVADEFGIVKKGNKAKVVSKDEGKK